MRRLAAAILMSIAAAGIPAYGDATDDIEGVWYTEDILDGVWTQWLTIYGPDQMLTVVKRAYPECPLMKEYIDHGYWSVQGEFIVTYFPPVYGPDGETVLRDAQNHGYHIDRLEADTLEYSDQRSVFRVHKERLRDPTAFEWPPSKCNAKA